ncbi:Predicted DNA-binding transcriptional regulator YafY, contains an HTH and WYL domains [Formivibrio citricus]|uniref:Predicted DNA-binding transcriptional regulator YafY, contains an HTH and WYL domains n=1 Tax=Formivibrio citricus TaxID=83765 RepID=A0A1I4Z4Y8_9NEIS|nr:WYL domain-containing protein [Formivibrio citricus]SFN44940.1 Predicted DNA-binding transcriptional regulator YafY, contains an HTH and WYL domains [Formivibrio citricus]
MANHDALFRQWELLRNIPRLPLKISVQELRERLVAAQFNVAERTIQRDLQELFIHFALVVDERSKPFGWSWQKNVKSLDFPALGIDEALTWVLAEQHISQILPSSAIEHLSPYFKAARNRLDREPQPQKGRSWLNKVRTVPPTQPLIPPAIDEDVQRIISEALMREQQIALQYRRKGEREAKAYQAHPLALIQRGGILYLFARLFDYPNARLLALHRIEEATLLDGQTAQAPEGFDLDSELAKGRLDFGAGERIQVQLRFYDGKGEHLHETPLSQDQHIREDADPNTLTITASVANTPQLQWWLLGFGGCVEVLAPESLRHSLTDTAAKMLARYTQPISGNA